MNKGQITMIGGALANPQQEALARRFSIFSEVSYFNDPLDKRKLLDKYGKKNWTVVYDGLTNQDVTTFRSNETGEIIIAVRGTDLRNINDLLTDLAVIGSVSSFTPRQAVIDRVVADAIRKFGKDKITLVGHSLGSRIAINAANKFQLKAYVFNTATSPLDFLTKTNKNITDISTNTGKNFDVISWFSKLFNKHEQVELNPTASSTHALANYLPQNEEQIAMSGTGRKNISIRRGNIFNPSIGKRKGMRIKG